MTMKKNVVGGTEPSSSCESLSLKYNNSFKFLPVSSISLLFMSEIDSEDNLHHPSTQCLCCCCGIISSKNHFKIIGEVFKIPGNFQSFQCKLKCDIQNVSNVPEI